MADLQRENEELHARLADAEAALQAIREGQVDALVAYGPSGPKIYSLSGAETIYRLAVQTMTESMVKTTSNGKILFCNSRFGELIGLPLERIFGRNLSELVPPSDREFLRALLQECVRQPIKRRVTFLASNGTIQPTLVSGRALIQENEVSLCLVAADIGELENSAHQIEQLRETERALRESERRFRRAADASGTAIYEVDLLGKTKITAYNLTSIIGEDCYGKELSRQWWQDRIHPDDQPGHIAYVGQCLGDSACTAYRAAYRVRHVDGSWRDVEDAAEIERDGNGRSIRLVGAIQDVTEQRMAVQKTEELMSTLNSLIASAPVGIVLLDAEMRFQHINQPLAEMNGLPVEAHLGKSVLEVVPALYEEVKSLFDRVYFRGETIPYFILEGETPKAPG